MPCTHNVSNNIINFTGFIIQGGRGRGGRGRVGGGERGPKGGGYNNSGPRGGRGGNRGTKFNIINLESYVLRKFGYTLLL